MQREVPNRWPRQTRGANRGEVIAQLDIRRTVSIFAALILVLTAGLAAAQDPTPQATDELGAASVIQGVESPQPVEGSAAGAEGVASPDATPKSVTADAEATPPQTTLPPLTSTVNVAASAREASLAGVLAARRQIEADLLERQAALRSDASRGREAEIEGEIRELSDELSSLNRNFSELAAGVDPGSIEVNQSPAEINLTSEVRDLLGPLVNELKRATSRPREIDRLRTEIAESGSRLRQVNAALKRLDRIEESVTDPIVIDAIKSEKRDWNRRSSAISTSLKVSQQKLDQRLGESQSIAQAVENLFSTLR